MSWIEIKTREEKEEEEENETITCLANMCKVLFMFEYRLHRIVQPQL